MARVFVRAGAAAAVAAAAAGWAGLAHAACDVSGIIFRIEGHPQDVVITRTESGARSVMKRPPVLEPVCRDDIVHVVGETYVVVSIDGSSEPVRIDHRADYIVPAPAGAPNVFGNAFRAIEEKVMPDIERHPWNVRIKGLDDLDFALPDLADGGQQVRAGSRALVVRLVGGTPPYLVEVRDAQGGLVAKQSSDSHEVVLPGVILSAGRYRIVASDKEVRVVDGAITAVDAGPPVDPTFDGIPDAEARAAYAAIALAHSAPSTWAFEAEQQLEAAPVHGLDRDWVYGQIEIYSPD